MNNKHISKRFLYVRHENAAGGQHMLLDSLWECMIWDFLCLVQFPVVLKRQSCYVIFSHAGCLPLAPSRSWGCRFKKDWCFFRKHTECMYVCVCDPEGLRRSRCRAWYYWPSPSVGVVTARYAATGMLLYVRLFDWQPFLTHIHTHTRTSHLQH